MEFVTKLIHAFSLKADAFLFMWAIMTTGVFALAIVIERFIYLTVRQGTSTELFVKNILSYIEKEDIPSAIVLCKKAKNMAIAGVLKAGLEDAGAGAERIKNTVDEAMLKMIPRLEQRTGYLAVIGNVATLLGLLGTVYGLIMSFAAVGKPGIDAAQKSELLASGIATAMNSTFLGLSVAITAIMVYSFLRAKTQRIVDELDEYSLRVMNTLVERSYKTHKYHISAAQLKEGVGLHITHNNIKIFTDNKMIKEINI